MNPLDLRTLLDESAIRSVIARYAHHVDARSIPDIADCFVEDACFEGADGSVRAVGRAAISEFFEAAFSTPRLAPPAASTQLMSNTVVDLDGDVAHAETQALALLASRAEGLVSRGLRYSDDLIRTPIGWRIAHRIHRCEWEATTGHEVVRIDGPDRSIVDLMARGAPDGEGRAGWRGSVERLAAVDDHVCAGDEA